MIIVIYKMIAGGTKVVNEPIWQQLVSCLQVLLVDFKIHAPQSQFLILLELNMRCI